MITKPQYAALFASSAVRPSLSLNFLTMGSTLDPRITFTRAANTATFFGSNGLLQTANANVARFDYNPLTLVLRGLLIEQASTNIAIQNRDLTNAAWTKVTTTAALDQTGIDGSANSASSITATLGNGTVLQTVVHIASTDTFSVYIKRITGTGEIDISTDGVTWTNITAQINSSTYSRVTVTQAAVVNPACGIRIVTSGDKIAVDYSQLEVLGFATSPIATTTVAVARNADVATMATSGFGFNANAGTLLVAAATYAISANPYFVDISNGTGGSADRIILATNGATGQIQTQAFTSTVRQWILNTSNALTNSVFQKLAISWDSSVQSVVLGSGTLQTATTPISLPVGLNLLSLGKPQDTAAASILNGWFQQVKYWPQRLSNAQIQAMTV